jgi:hypothetical protein
MSHRNKYFKNWLMPGKDTGIKPNPAFYAWREQGSYVEQDKEYLYSSYEKYKELCRELRKLPEGEEKEELDKLKEEELNTIYQEKQTLRSRWFELFNTSWGQQMKDENADQIMPWPKWNHRHCSTMVHHVMYDDTRSKPEVGMSSAIMYLLQDPRSGLSPNLVAPFRSSESEDVYEANMTWLWERLKSFFLTDAGDMLMDTLFESLDSKDYDEEDEFLEKQNTYGRARNRIRELKSVMSTATRVHSGAANQMLGVNFLGDRYKEMQLVYNGGNIKMLVCDSIPDFEDLDPLLFPPDVTNLVSGIYQNWKDSSPGIFVSIIYESSIDSRRRGEHYMYLTEYNTQMVHATMAHGWKDHWMHRVNNMPSFQTKEVALKLVKNVIPYYTELFDEKGIVIGHVPKKKTVINPFNEKDLMDFMVMNILSGSDILSDAQDKPEWIENIRASYEREVPDFFNMEESEMDDIMIPYFYMGNEFAFAVLLFDASNNFVRDLFKMGREIPVEKEYYVMSLVLRYPIINLDIMKTMTTVRYKYFDAHTSPEDKSKFSDWLHGRWFLPEVNTEQELDENTFADKFQVFPKASDHLDWVKEEDRQNRWRYSLRLPAYVPRHVTFDYLFSKRRFMDDSFFVNGLEADQDIVYVYTPDLDATWDDLQLFRMQAEVKVSRKGYTQHNESFFTFKSKNLPTDTRGTHPFGLYLEKHPDLRDEWRKVWHEKWPDMEGWERISLEERREANREEREHQERPERQRAEPQRQHRGRQGRNQPQERRQRQGRNQPAERRQRAGPRGPNRGPAHRPGARPPVQKQGKGRRARRRERANGVRPQQRAALRWPTNFKRVLSERRQNEKFLLNMTCPSFTPQ